MSLLPDISSTHTCWWSSIRSARDSRSRPPKWRRVLGPLNPFSAPRYRAFTIFWWRQIQSARETVVALLNFTAVTFRYGVSTGVAISVSNEYGELLVAVGRGLEPLTLQPNFILDSRTKLHLFFSRQAIHEWSTRFCYKLAIAQQRLSNN